mmetsp:Transcript_5270/g.8318  ORF Transcript_5270/g.8318 Transcript_5270/m.8318 type:complete len:826 (-) Transcript_5270:305-2782(-)
MKAEEDSSKEIVRKDGSVDLAALRRQTGAPSSRAKSLDVPEPSGGHSRAMSMEDTAADGDDAKLKTQDDNVIMQVESAGPPSKRKDATSDNEAEKRGLETEALKPALFKAMCDVIWPVDKSVAKIFEIWHNQGFQVPQIAELVQYPNLPRSRNLRACGFVQWRNGPCGMLAAVQAWVIRFYLFAPCGGEEKGGRSEEKSQQKSSSSSSPTVGLTDLRDPTSRTDSPATAPYPPAVSAIHLALVEVIWRSCVEVSTTSVSSSSSSESSISNQQGHGAFVVLRTPPSAEESGSADAKKERGGLAAPKNFYVAHLQSQHAISGRYPGYQSQLRIVRWKGKEQLSKIVQDNLERLMGPGGIVMLLYSLVLTRGVEKVKAELWASHTATLIANRNGYCNQELVNLLLVGQATAGIHDDSNKEISAACGKGIQGPVDLGFFPPKPMAKLLGNHLKSPTFPIWVVLAKSHYSLVFLPSKDGYDPTTFDVFSKNGRKALTLYHYNGLNSLRWREPHDFAKDHKNLRSYKGPRIAYSILRPKKWAILEKELLSKMSQEGSVLGSSAQADRWLCPTCTYSNGPSAQQCQMCSTRRPASSGGATAMPYCVFASRLNDVKFLSAKQEKVAPQAPRTESHRDIEGREEKAGERRSCDDGFTVDLDGTYEFQVQRLDGKKPETAKPQTPWSCSTCTYRNPPSRTLCQMCGTSKTTAPPKDTHWQCATCTFRNPNSSGNCQMCSAPNPNPASQQLLDPNQPYQCVSCSVINNPALNPSKCGVCGKIRQRLELCEWRTCDSLPESMHEEVYKFLPDLMTTMHILWPRTTLIYTGSQPSMTT